MLAKEIARAFGRPWPAVQYELKQSVLLAMEDPEIAALFDRWPTPDEYFKKTKQVQKQGKTAL